MRYGILGPTLVRGDNGQELPVGGPGLRALLARLLLDPGRVVGTDRLIEDLYGDQPPAGAANALQAQVSRLRRVLPEPGQVELHPAGYRLAVDPDDVDAHRFTRLAEAGRQALSAGRPAPAADLLTEALDQWRGPALADVPAPFAPAQVARLEELRLSALADRAQALLALGEPEPLVPELRALVAQHPLRERLRALLMRALYGSGRAAEALAEYDDARRRLAEELGADPSPELAEVHLAVLRAEPTQAGRSRLPAQLTSFVGRDEELRRVGKLLAEARLVTLTGPGGAGKTRLAVEAAAQQPGESAFVDLAPLVNGAELPQAALTALGLRDAGLRDAGLRSPTAEPPDPLGKLAAALADRRLLLLLDNCEHMVEAAARLADRLLRDCPQLRILATSREPLGLTGEALWPLSGLAEAAAVRLFRDRAADGAPQAVLDDEAVRRICRTLDGLPLAIELAAARLRALPLAEVVARLDDRFQLLSRGSRTAQPRHQTLRAVVSWSWELLDAPERALARRLTVFAGGASLAAVARVCDLPPEDAVELLASLVDKSLVETSAGRYRMLETIRAFGAERLAEAGETDQLRRAHAGYFLELAQTADPHLRRAEQLEWLARLDADRDNLHVAVRRAVAGGDVTTALRLVASLAMYWWLRGVRGESAALAAEVLAAAHRPPAGLVEEHALCVLTVSLAGLGGPGPRVGLEQAATVMYTMEGPPRYPFLYFLSGMATGPPAGGPEQVVEMMEWMLARSGGDPWTVALGKLGLALLWALRDDLPAAEPVAEAALAQFRQLGERWGMTMTLSALAEIAHAQGDHARATAAMDEALRLAGELDSTMDVAELRRVRAQGLLAAGDLDQAVADFRQAEALAGRVGAQEVRAAARLGLAEVARHRGDLAGARALAEAAVAEPPTGWFPSEETRAAALITLGQIAEAEGDVGAARDAYREAMAVTVGGRAVSTASAAEQALSQLDARSAEGAEPSAGGR